MYILKIHIIHKLSLTMMKITVKNKLSLTTTHVPMKMNIINKQQEELLAREAVEKGKIKLALEKSYVEPGRQQGRLLVQCEKKGYGEPPQVNLLVSSFFYFFYFFPQLFFYWRQFRTYTYS